MSSEPANVTHMGVDNSPTTSRSRSWLVAIVTLTTIVLLAYIGSIDNGFHQIDDHRHLANGAGLPFPNGHFRPGQEWTFRLLYQIFGTWAAPYHVLALVFHLGCCILIFRLVWKLFDDVGLGLATAAVFACLFASHQAVLWIGANLGLQAVFFSLASLNAWLAWLHRPKASTLVIAFLLFGFSTLFKESGLITLPMMLLLQIYRKSLSDLLRRPSLLAWLPFALLAIALVLRGILVDSRTGLSLFSGNPLLLLDRLARSLGHLPLPLNYRAHRPGLQIIAVVVIGLPLLLAGLARRRDPLAMRKTLLALGILFSGYVMVLPVNKEITGERTYYDAAFGFSLLLTLGTWQFSLLLPLRTNYLHAIQILILLPWLAIHIHQIRTVEAWKYDAISRHVESLEASTIGIVRATQTGRTLLFMDPPLPDPRDFTSLLVVYTGQDEQRIRTLRMDPRGEGLRRLLAPSTNQRILRWSDESEHWRDFEPGGMDWLNAWRPHWWPGGGPDDPRIPPLIRIVELQKAEDG